MGRWPLAGLLEYHWENIISSPIYVSIHFGLAQGNTTSIESNDLFVDWMTRTMHLLRSVAFHVTKITPFHCGFEKNGCACYHEYNSRRMILFLDQGKSSLKKLIIIMIKIGTSISYLEKWKLMYSAKNGSFRRILPFVFEKLLLRNNPTFTEITRSWFH